MGDLISRNALILYLNDIALTEAPSRTGEKSDRYEAIMDCIEAVEKFETSYNLDRVVEQLEELRDRYYCSMGYPALKRAIEIVKAGGKDD